MFAFLLLLDHGTPPDPGGCAIYPFVMQGHVFIVNMAGEYVIQGSVGACPLQLVDVARPGSSAITLANNMHARSRNNSYAITPTNNTEALN